MPTFTVDWFSHNIPSWNQVFDGLGWLESDKALQALEVHTSFPCPVVPVAVDIRSPLCLQVGSWEGQSACWLLENVCCSPESRLVCIDTWAGAQQYGLAAQVH